MAFPQTYERAVIDALLAGARGDGVGVNVEDYGTPGFVNDSSLVQSAVNAASLAGVPLRLRPGVIYRAGGLTIPVGLVLDARWSGITLPSGGTAQNMFNAVGAWTLLGGSFDGNKGATASPGVYTAGGNGVYQYSATGWLGRVELLMAPKFQNFWFEAVVGLTDTSALTDGKNAPYARMYLDRIEAANCGSIGMRFTGLRGVQLFKPDCHDNGSHGARAFLCRELEVIGAHCHDNASGHGFSSLYCYDQEFDGKFNRNGTDGLVFGGDSTSATNQPGRYIRGRSIEANENGNIGLVLDATITGGNNPVPVWAQFDIVHADGNVNEGAIVNSSQWVFFSSIFTDSNGGHGLELSTANAGFGFHHAHNNGQKPLALEGSAPNPHWGGHFLSPLRDYAGNAPDDTNTIGTVLANSTWGLSNQSQDAPPDPAPVYRQRKTGDTGRSSSVLTTDPELQFASVPVGEYELEGYVIWDAAMTADLATQWNLPAGSIVWFMSGLVATSSTANPATLNANTYTGATGPVLGGLGVGVTCSARISGWLKVTAPGVLNFKWAQNNVDGSVTTLHAGSWIRLTKVA